MADSRTSGHEAASASAINTPMDSSGNASGQSVRGQSGVQDQSKGSSRVYGVKKVANRNGISGVYQIRNMANNRVYIGSSGHIYQRWSTHLSCLRRGVHDNRELQSDWDAFGESGFVFEVIEMASPDRTASAEAHWLSLAVSAYNMREPVQLPPYRKPTPHPEYCTVQEAQELLGVSGPKMWRLVRDGDLVATPDPLDKRRKMLRRADVEALARFRPLDNRRKPTPPTDE